MALLKKGDSGQAVQDLQKLLQELDYNVPITGVFDTAPKKQKRRSLVRAMEQVEGFLAQQP